MDLVDRMVGAKLLEVGDLVDILASQGRRGTSVRDLLEKVGVPPRDNVLYPLQVVLLVRLTKTDDRLDTKVT